MLNIDKINFTENTNTAILIFSATNHYELSIILQYKHVSYHTVRHLKCTQSYILIISQ